MARSAKLERGSANRLRTLVTILGLCAMAPVNFMIVATCFAATLLREAPKPSGDRRTILISGGKMTKALQLARAFHAAGHRVILTETRKYQLTGHRFSRAVARFYVVPDPRDAHYADALLEIVKSEGVDVYVPVCSPAASVFDARAIPGLKPFCDVVHLEPDIIGEVDDKYRFAKLAGQLGLAAPKSFLITDAAQVETFNFAAQKRRFILKSIAYDPIRRLDLTLLPCASSAQTSAFARALPISAENPWVLQEFIPGREYCTHGTLRDGALTVHCCCESSAVQLNYQHIDHPKIYQWVQRFAAGLKRTGQVSLDFIEADDDGEVYAIECNPRTHSAITMLYDRDDLAGAYLGEPVAAPVQPCPQSRPTYWLYHELWRLAAAARRGSGVRARLRSILRGKDAVFDWRDPLPFFMLHHVHIPVLLLADLRDGRGWHRIDFNIGKLVQPGGD